ncbi:MAG: insulinase family protein [Chloroflexi bacterium]|nr:insulinase family protein [Chloroflexota bacterium]MDA8189733.1 pitrilysin family protein [Dehalococcoidales bacterium]
MEYEKTVLDNGLRVVTSQMPYALSVSVAIFFSAGSRNEAREISGISHFIEHMLFKGTQKRPAAKDISEAVEGTGGVLNAETGKEITVYWAKVAHNHWPTAADVLTDILLHSQFDPVEIEKERKVIVEELNMLVDTPQDWVHVLFDETMWGDQPLGRDIAGTKESVRSITREQMLQYLHDRYLPGAAVIAVAGPLSHSQVVDTLEPLVREWRAAPVLAGEPTIIPPGETRVRLQQRKTEQAQVCIGYPGLSYVHPDRYALDLLNVVLGEGMSSRLFLEIREKRGLAYDVHSYINHYRDAGSAVIYAGVDPKRVDKTIEAALSEIDKIKENLPEYEVAKAKEFWKGRLLLRLEDTRSVASWLGGQELILDRIFTLQEVVKIIDSISVPDLHRVAREIFVHDRINLAVIGPFAKEERFRKLVKP